MTIEQSSLDPGERVLWQGKADVEAYCKRRHTPMPNPWIGFALLGAGVVTAALAYPLGHIISGFGELAALLFLAAAVIFYLPFRFRRGARRVSYALTDQRAIIDAPGLLLANRTSTRYSDIRSIDVRNDKYGDVLFRVYVTESEHQKWLEPDGFFAIAEVRKVERIFRAAMAKAAEKAHMESVA